MCEFCAQHGEGKKWYLQAKNYEAEILQGEPRRGMTDNLQLREENLVNRYVDQDKLIASGFEAARAKIVSASLEQKKKSHGQIVPLEEALQILDLSSNIVRLPCPCRTIRGVHNARYCLGLNLEQKDIQAGTQYPDYSKDFEVLSKEEAKKIVRGFEQEGTVHLVAAQTSFIVGMCNCDATYCGALQSRTRFNAPLVYFKSEYVSTIDWEKCNGCRDCMKICHSGAITYSPTVEKCYINQFKCWGSGLCRSVCHPQAITMRDRNTIPGLAQEW